MNNDVVKLLEKIGELTFEIDRHKAAVDRLIDYHVFCCEGCQFKNECFSGSDDACKTYLRLKAYE
jgi:hypothetical protein